MAANGLTPDTLVWVGDNTSVPISEIALDDDVMTPNGFDTVVSITRFNYRGLFITLRFRMNKNIRVPQRQRLITEQAGKQVAVDIEVGTRFRSYDPKLAADTLVGASSDYATLVEPLIKLKLARGRELLIGSHVPIVARV